MRWQGLQACPPSVERPPALQSAIYITQEQVDSIILRNLTWRHEFLTLKDVFKVARQLSMYRDRHLQNTMPASLAGHCDLSEPQYHWSGH